MFLPAAYHHLHCSTTPVLGSRATLPAGCLPDSLPTFVPSTFPPFPLYYRLVLYHTTCNSTYITIWIHFFACIHHTYIFTFGHFWFLHISISFTIHACQFRCRLILRSTWGGTIHTRLLLPPYHLPHTGSLPPVSVLRLCSSHTDSAYTFPTHTGFPASHFAHVHFTKTTIYHTPATCYHGSLCSFLYLLSPLIPRSTLVPTYYHQFCFTVFPSVVTTHTPAGVLPHHTTHHYLLPACLGYLRLCFTLLDLPLHHTFLLHLGCYHYYFLIPTTYNFMLQLSF